MKYMMMFDESQPQIAINEITEGEQIGLYEVTICMDYHMEWNAETDTMQCAYSGNQFITTSELTKDEIMNDLDKYLNYSGDVS